MRNRSVLILASSHHLRPNTAVRRILLFVLFSLTSCATAFHTNRLHEVDAAIETAIAARKLPGGVIWIEHEGHTYTRAYGDRALVPEREAMTRDTVFDAASITKTVATAPSIWLLIRDGKLEVDAPAKRYLPEMADDRITIRHLLTHTSGLPPGLNPRDVTSYESAIRLATALQPLNAPGAIFRYSDCNFILLGEIVQRVAGETLDRFAARRIFEPLGMRDTGYRPAGRAPGAAVALSRIAPTENTSEGMLRGVVHDPTARAMGGVAGHAGLFTTAADLAKYARALLAGTVFPRELTTVMSPPGVAMLRTGGLDYDSGYSRPRGDHFPLGSFGHTGFTGGFYWIDPQSRSFYVFLSNRVHPDGGGSVTALQRELGTLVAETLRGATFCGNTLPASGPVAPACPPRRVGWLAGGGDAMNGIDVLRTSGYEALRGMRIGLVTNQSGTDGSGNPTIDVLRSAPGVTLVALFSPEHGIRGLADENVNDGVDAITGLPIYSLYGERRKPSSEQLAGLDALVFDIQDIGTRFYTYIATMGLAMEAAADAHVKFIVLDRVNPIGGDVVEGPMLEGERNFTGWHDLPVRHGMTVGELAKMFREERKIDVDLTVIPVRGWKREQWQDEAGLAWINTSPNMRSLNAAALYPGIGLLERAISVGRGTATPFEVLGTPYIDGAKLIAELGPTPGVQLAPIRFTPTASIHQGKECGGIRITITDRRALRSVTLGLRIAAALHRLYPGQFPLDELQPLLRNQSTLNALRDGRVQDGVSEAFMERRAKFLLYPAP
jgi:uncharacterized protein YbbC (DUF1343 family)/CubicO group peptidase (beta-lactamase class C family)